MLKKIYKSGTGIYAQGFLYLSKNDQKSQNNDD